MLLSIVIPTIGRKNELQNLLNSIYLMDCKNFTFEVIVVNQNPKGFLDNILTEFMSKDSFTLYNVEFKGLSKAKNFGVKNANGNYITFPDDDCKVFDNSYNIAIKLINDLGLDIISGKCVDGNGNDSVQKFKKGNWYLNQNNFEGGFIEATCVIRKEIFDNFDYDENIGAGTFFGAHEGYDWIFRVLKNTGYKIYYSDNIKFYHPQVILNKGDFSSLKRVNSYTYGFVYSRLKNKEYFSLIKRLVLSFVLVFFYLPFSINKSNYYRVEFLSILLSIPFVKASMRDLH
jgi:glycosyltransferase involved in cell wall biosynthesis